jgi:hypothetical protein
VPAVSTTIPTKKKPFPFAAILLMAAIAGLVLGAALGIGVRAAADKYRVDRALDAGHAIHAEI